MAERADLIDLGQEATVERAVPLEKKYREQMRQIVSQKIELPVATLVDMIEEQINLNPDFQMTSPTFCASASERVYIREPFVQFAARREP